MATRVLPSDEHDALGLGRKRVKVQCNGWLLAQLMLAPVAGIGQRVRGLRPMRHRLLVGDGEELGVELGLRRLHPRGR
jgi:hypothetical protein